MCVCVCVCVCVCDLSILLHGGQAEVSAQNVFLLTRELQNGQANAILSSQCHSQFTLKYYEKSL